MPASCSALVLNPGAGNSSFLAEPHFEWYHKEREALLLMRSAEATRTDREGRPIAKQIGSQHKVTFRDLVNKGENIKTVYIVESYKEYNKLPPPEDDDDNVDACMCTMF